MVGNDNIEIVNNYTYLGVKFSANGNFTNHKKNLTEKTKRSFFCRSSLSSFSKITNSHHQQTVQYPIFPILTFYSEVWGIYEKAITAAGIKTPLRKRIYIFVRFVWV